MEEGASGEIRFVGQNMMTDDSSDSDIAAGVTWLLEGKTFPFEGVVFSIDHSRHSPLLDVDSYSEFLRLENVHEAEAHEKIARSKQVGERLSLRFPAFSDIWRTYRKVYNFCYDYGTGAVVVASEDDGRFIWHKR
jgi:hypothetical protein